MVLSAEEKDVLRMTPEQALAKGDLMGMAEQHRRRCQEMMGAQSDQICEKIDETMHHLRLADLKNLHEFLGGTMEPSKFQEQHHRNMVAWQLELEGYLSWDQLMHYPAIQAGDDPFLVVTAWGIGVPPGYTMGEDIVARRPGAAPDENPPDDPRNPWTYGTKIAHGEKP